jgi:hypothetical protein
VGALLNDLAVCYYSDVVCVHDGRELMGNYYGSTIPRNAIESSQHNMLTTNVQRTRSFVENQDSGLPNDCPSNSNSLALTAAEMQA